MKCDPCRDPGHISAIKVESEGRDESRVKVPTACACASMCAPRRGESDSTLVGEPSVELCDPPCGPSPQVAKACARCRPRPAINSVADIFRVALTAARAAS